MAEEQKSYGEHPIKAIVPTDEWAEFVRQVQYCEISWPIGLNNLRIKEIHNESNSNVRADVD